MLISWPKITKNAALVLVCLCFYLQFVTPQKTHRIGSSFLPGPSNRNFSTSTNSKISKIKQLAQLKHRASGKTEDIDYKIRGVNLGGWLVLEPWITPSIFERHDPYAIDEWTLCEYLGKDQCLQELEEHWSSFISKDDLQKLKDGGINTIRIPVGYWIFGDIHDDEPWVVGSKEYLEKSIQWAADIGLDVLIDLHCAPGSQNGFDNSGRRGDIHFDDVAYKPDGTAYYPNIERTIATLEAIASAYLWMDNVIGLEYLNEPFVTIDLDRIKSFYLTTYPKTTNGWSKTFISDAFRFWDWFGFMEYPDYENIYLDTHHYEMFDTWVLGWSQEEHINNVCQNVKKDLAGAPLWNVVGEWSLATTDCAKWLNGYGRGARWDKTFQSDTYFGTCEGRNSSSSFTSDYKIFLNQWAEYQMDAYEADAGWFFWTAKTEDVTAPQWDYLEGLKQGWIPKQSERTLKCP